MIDALVKMPGYRIRFWIGIIVSAVCFASAAFEGGYLRLVTIGLGLSGVAEVVQALVESRNDRSG